MNPTHSLAPALLSGVWFDLWLYWTATFVSTLAVTLYQDIEKRFE